MQHTRVFLSYLRKEALGALAVYRWLREQAFDVFIDFEGLRTGSFESDGCSQDRVTAGTGSRSRLGSR